MPISGAVESFLKPEEKTRKCIGAKPQATSFKPQATSVKRSHYTDPVHVLKIDLTERYNYEYTRSMETSRRPEPSI